MSISKGKGTIMKRVFILTFMLVAIAITAAYAGQQLPILAQANAPAAVPSAVPEVPKAPAPAQAAITTTATMGISIPVPVVGSL